MTTATTVLGLLPMAMGVGDGAEIRQPMAITVIAGLSFSTLLTLIVIPTVYASVDRLLGGNTREAPSVLLHDEIGEVSEEQLAPENFGGQVGIEAGVSSGALAGEVREVVNRSSEIDDNDAGGRDV